MFDSIVIPLDRYQIDVFTWGDSSLLGYHSSRSTLLRLHSFGNGQSDVDRYSLSFSPSPSPVRRLILNSAETIVALLTDECVYLVNLPREKCSSNSLRPSPITTTTRPLDLLWLTEREYLVVSSSHCDLYSLRSKHLRRFSTSDERDRKRICLDQGMDIVQVSLVRRERELFLFALSANGELDLLTLAEDQLITDLQSDFVGPVQFSPWKFDNYGADYSHSKMLSFCSSGGSIVVVLSNARCELVQCLFLSPSSSSLLYNIDSLVFPSIRSLLLDRVNGNRYYLLDGQSNVFSIELRWIEQIEGRQEQLTSTKIDKLIQADDLQIEQIGLLQTSSQGQCLALINRQRKLILCRPPSFVSPSSVSVSRVDRRRDVPVDFERRLRTFLQSNRSFPSGPNLLLSLSEEFLERQEKVRQRLENKQRYLFDFHQIQLSAHDELTRRLKEIEEKMNLARERFEEESARHRRLLASLDDQLASVEVQRAVLSDAERLMHQTLEKYQLQSNALGEKIRLLADSLANRAFDEKNDRLALDGFQPFLQYYQNQIHQMKQRIE